MNELVEEHKLARESAREIVQPNEKYRQGNRGVVARIKEIVAWLGGFYPVHIRKEDTLFFPDAEKYFSAEELDAMLAHFNSFDRDMIHEKYQLLLDQFLGKGQ
jgi:hemerythrin-like domain-containing protein